MTLNPTTFRFPFKHPDDLTDQGFRLMQQGILDLNQAIASLHSQVQTNATNVKNITQQVNASTTTITGTTLPVNVNQQTADYILQQTDFGGVVVFSGTGPYALTPNQGITQPFFTSVLNLSSGNVVVTPVVPNLINNLTDITILPTQWAIIFFDSINWWALDLQILPQTIANAAHKWMNSYDAATGLFTQTQPDYSDLTGLPQLAQTIAAATHQFLTSYNAATGVFTQAQPAYSDIVWGFDTTANRPASPTSGEPFFDSTLGIPIWWNGANWVDATGATV